MVGVHLVGEHACHDVGAGRVQVCVPNRVVCQHALLGLGNQRRRKVNEPNIVLFTQCFEKLQDITGFPVDRVRVGVIGETQTWSKRTPF